MDKPEHSPAPGASGPGKTYEPADDEEKDNGDSTPRPRSAPSPGVPVSDEAYKRMKESATRRKPSDDVPAQKDPANS